MWLKFEKKISKIVRVIVRAVLKKRVSRKTRLKFWVEYERRPTRLRKKTKLNRKKKFSYMKPFASYSRRFKLNFKQKKTDFLKSVHWCCPFKAVIDIFLIYTINCLIKKKHLRLIILFPKPYLREQNQEKNFLINWTKLFSIKYSVLNINLYSKFSLLRCFFVLNDVIDL